MEEKNVNNKNNKFTISTFLYFYQSSILLISNTNVSSTRTSYFDLITVVVELLIGMSSEWWIGGNGDSSPAKATELKLIKIKKINNVFFIISLLPINKID